MRVAPDFKAWLRRLEGSAFEVQKNSAPRVSGSRDILALEWSTGCRSDTLGVVYWASQVSHRLGKVKQPGLGIGLRRRTYAYLVHG